MLVETVYLYRQIVVVFVTNAVFQKLRNLLFIGWLTPLFISIVNTKIFINRYNETDICYLSANDNSIWAFAAPASLVLCINLVLMITICYIISKLEYQGANDKAKTLQRVKSTLRSIIFLFPLTGTCWLFGIMSLQKEMHIAFQYLFTITNSFQGLFLLLFHCLFQNDVQTRLKSYNTHRRICFCCPFYFTSKVGSSAGSMVGSLSSRPRSSKLSLRSRDVRTESTGTARTASPISNRNSQNKMTEDKVEGRRSVIQQRLSILNAITEEDSGSPRTKSAPPPRRSVLIPPTNKNGLTPPRLSRLPPRNVSFQPEVVSTSSESMSSL